MRKKKHFFLYFCISGILSLCGGFLGYYYTLNYTQAQNMDKLNNNGTLPIVVKSVPTPTPGPSIPPSPQSKYVILEKDGIVKVYEEKSNARTLISSVDINLQSLRTEDRLILKNGIYASSKEELLEILENFAN